MKIKLLRGVVVNGVACRAGDVVDASPAQAKYLVTLGKAEVSTDTATPTNTPTAKKGGGKKKE